MPDQPEKCSHCDRVIYQRTINKRKTMRELTSHKINECNDAITISVLDEPGQGGACHEYKVSYRAIHGHDPEGFDPILIHFQNGPIKEVGTNGITQEVLLAILIDRLEHFQRGPYACEENAVALQALIQAQTALHSRTKARVVRGVEGTHTP